MRLNTILLLLFVTNYSFGNNHKVIITFSNSINNKQVTHLDTIKIFQHSKLIRQVTNVKVFNNKISIDTLGYGEHEVLFISTRFTILPYLITVCDNCENAMSVTVYPNSANKKDWDITSVEISPSYKGPKGKLRFDFFKGFTQEEKSEVLNSSFYIELVICKSGQLCNKLIVDSLKISASTLVLIEKGITNLKIWQPAIMDG